MIDIVLVNPSSKKVYGKLGESLAGIEPPLWTGLLAGFVRNKGFSVKIIDADAEGWGPEEMVEEIIRYGPILVGIGAVGANPSASSTPKMAAARNVLTLLKEKKPNIKSVLYGIHPSALPERTLTEEPVDFICRGETFYPVSELLAVFKSNGIKSDYSIKGLWYKKSDDIVSSGWANLVANLDELPFIAWDLLPMDKYRAHNWHCFGHTNDRSSYAIIYTSLGCPFNCRYCNIHALYDGKPGIRFRSPKRVLEEIDLLVRGYQIKHLKILDELFVIKGERLDEICDLLIERNYGLNIWAYARVDTVNEKILRKLKKAGINWLCYGIEAANKNVRNKIAKGRFNQDMIKKAAQMTHDAGISILGNFMFGLPDDDMETMKETFTLAQEIDCEYVNFYTTMAYPGSQLYQEAIDQGIALPKNWIGFSQFNADTLPMSTKYVSAADVLRFRDDAFVEFYRNLQYEEMIKRKFGQETLNHIHQMLKQKIHRKILSRNEAATIK